MKTYSVKLGVDKTHVLTLDIQASDISEAIQKAQIAWKRVFQFAEPNRVLIKTIVSA